MDDTEHIIAIVYRVNNYSDGIYVVNFVKCLSLKIHFAVNSVYRLDPAVDVEIFKVKLGQAFFIFSIILFINSVRSVLRSSKLPRISA